MTVSSLSKEYIHVPVDASLGGTAYDPTADVVSFALPATGVAPTVWVVGSWLTVGSTYYARVLVGPGTSFILTAGVYDVWVKVTDSPEIPVRRSGFLRVV